MPPEFRDGGSYMEPCAAQPTTKAPTPAIWKWNAILAVSVQMDANKLGQIATSVE